MIAFLSPAKNMQFGTLPAGMVKSRASAEKQIKF